MQGSPNSLAQCLMSSLLTLFSMPLLGHGGEKVRVVGCRLVGSWPTEFPAQPCPFSIAKDAWLTLAPSQNPRQTLLLLAEGTDWQLLGQMQSEDVLCLASQ